MYLEINLEKVNNGWDEQVAKLMFQYQTLYSKFHHLKQSILELEKEGEVLKFAIKEKEKNVSKLESMISLLKETLLGARECKQTLPLLETLATIGGGCKRRVLATIGNHKI